MAFFLAFFNNEYLLVSSFPQLSAAQKDKDEFFIERRTFLDDYHTRIRETTSKTEQLSESTNAISVDYMQVCQINC